MRRRTVFALILLILPTILVLFTIGRFPLLDWDEAIYADVAKTTLQSGNFFTLSRAGGPWFEKPSLYIWSVMASFKTFGISEFSARLPSALFLVACVLLLYLIMLELGADEITSFLASLVLFFTSPFFVYGVQSRMDIPVIATILFSLLSFLKGRKDERWYLGVGIGLGVGVLTKAIIGLLAVIPIIVYSFVYRERQWLKNKFLWFGLGIGFIVIAPWHIYETAVYGARFWSQYLGTHILDRGLFADMQGMTNADYLKEFWLFDRPWSLIVLIFLPLALFALRRDIKEKKILLFGFLSALLILSFFLIARTKMWPYILPMYPFLSIFIAAGLTWILRKVGLLFPRSGRTIFVLTFSLLLVCAAAVTLRDEFVELPYVYYPYTFDERAIGNYLGAVDTSSPIHIYKWNADETIRFYSGKETTSVKTAPANGYLITSTSFLDAFYMENPSYSEKSLIYKGQFVSLLKSFQ